MEGLDPPIIVVADRDTGRASTAQRELRAGGFSVRWITDPDQWLDSREWSDCELVLLDARFPAARRILFTARRQGAAAPHVVVMSSSPTIEEALDATKSGAADYLPKPLDWRRVRNLATSLIEERRAASFAGDPSGGRDGLSSHAEATRSLRNVLDALLSSSGDDSPGFAINGGTLSNGDDSEYSGDHDESNGRPTSSRLCLIEQIEKQAILAAIARCHGNVVAAAKLLGLGQATVYRKIKRYSISLRETRSRRAPASSM